MNQTIQGTISQLHGSLRDYIEATYHISSPALIAQRKELLDRPGVSYQIPYIESTPRYQSGERFAAIKGMPSAALKAYSALTTPSGSLPALLYDPPYRHQSEAIRHTLVDQKNLLIMTGNGLWKNRGVSVADSGQARARGRTAPGFLSRPARRPRAHPLPYERTGQRPTRPVALALW